MEALAVLTKHARPRARISGGRDDPRLILESASESFEEYRE